MEGSDQEQPYANYEKQCRYKVSDPAQRLIEDIGNVRSHRPDPVVNRRPGCGGAVERRIERLVGDEAQQNEQAKHTQQKPDELGTAPVVEQRGLGFGLSLL